MAFQNWNRVVFHVCFSNTTACIKKWYVVHEAVFKRIRNIAMAIMKHKYATLCTTLYIDEWYCKVTYRWMHAARWQFWNTINFKLNACFVHSGFDCIYIRSFDKNVNRYYLFFYLYYILSSCERKLLYTRL